MNSQTADRLNSLGLHRSSVDEIARRSQVAHGNRLLMARPEGGFTSSPLEAAIARTGWSWGAAAADFDNNGYPDLYVANGHETRQSVRDYEREFWMHDIYVGTSADSLLASTYFISKSSRTRGQGDSYGGWEKNRLYLRDTAAGLVEVGHLMGVAIGEDCRNVVGTDLDADGKVDLLVTTFEVWPQRRQRFHVFRNKLDEGQNWIGFQFREKPGRPSAAGAIVRLHANNYGTVGQWIAGDSYRSQNNGPMHFGLGKTSAVETVEIRWPDGRVVSMKSPAINRYHPIEP
jgi:hypothetical protein